MVKINQILTLAAVAAAAMINTVLCADAAESALVRLNCEGNKQPGCDTEFIDKYPEVGMGYLNLTNATTRFSLYTNKSPDKPELLHKCGGQLPPNSTFNRKCKIEMMVPGYVSGSCNFAIYREMKDERLKSGCYNVILVDYMWGNIPDLGVTIKNLKIVAEQLAILVRNLKESQNLTSAAFIITAHSFGCHVAGMLGQMEPVDMIIGLDPGSSMFESKDTPLSERLDAGDAKCVVVLHCNAGPCLPSYFGVNYECGTVDFWINGGSIQPSCYEQTLKSFAKGDFIYGGFSLFTPACYHFQCLQYYRASMNPGKNGCSFIGSQCSSNALFQQGGCRDCGSNGENCLVFGINTCNCLTDDQKNKSYYLNTDIKCPFCDNSGLKKEGYSCAAANITNGITNP